MSATTHQRRDAGSDASAELASEADRLDALERLVGHRFRDREVALSALTHRSWLNEHATVVPHNERLELIGDAVLSLCTVDLMLEDTPDADEGALTERRAAYVSETALARAAAAHALGALLRAGRAATPPVTSALADVVEALLGAVYLDAGLGAARDVALRLLGRPPAAPPAPDKDNPKRILQERLQALYGEAPRYETARGDGPNHAPTYVATAVFRGAELGAGSGSNKQRATEDAAANALAALGDDAALVARFGPRQS